MMKGGIILGSDNNKNILGYDSTNNNFSSTRVNANKDGSVIERQEYIQSLLGGSEIYGSPNYLSVEIDFATTTVGNVATHEVFTVTGAVRAKILVECTENLISTGSGTIEFGVEGVTNAFIGTSLSTKIDDGEIWYGSSASAKYGASTTLMLDKVVSDLDIGYEVKTAGITNGNLVFHIFYQPLNATGAVAVNTGIPTL